MSRKYVFAVNTLISMLIGAAIGFTFARHSGRPHHFFSSEARHVSPDENKKFKQRFIDKKVKHLSKRLDLSTEQGDSLRVVLEGTSTRLKDLREKNRPLFREIKEQTKLKILEILTAEQKVKFQQMEEKRDRRRGKGMKHRGHHRK